MYNHIFNKLGMETWTYRQITDAWEGYSPIKGLKAHILDIL